MKESSEGVVTIHGVTKAVFEGVLAYIYTGILRLLPDLDTMAELYMAADMFQMKDLMEAVRQTMMCCREVLVYNIKVAKK